MYEDPRGTLMRKPHGTDPIGDILGVLVLLFTLTRIPLSRLIKHILQVFCTYRRLGTLAK